MSDALLAGVSGMKAHQQMIDVAGNNLANVSTTGFKSSRVRFSDLLSETLKDASQPTASSGGTNPLQIGGGVRLSRIDIDMAQGSLQTTGQPLDMAIEGSGYFVLNDGARDLYTRVGSFAVDADFCLVDPNTGYRVQRIGSEGVVEGFQNPSSSAIRVPYDVALAAKPTETVWYNGNLSADQGAASTTSLASGVEYTTSSRIGASADTLLTDLAQGGATLVNGDVIVVNGTRRDGSAVTNQEFACFSGGVSKTVGDLLDFINAKFADPADPTDQWSVATIENAQIRLADSESGYSLTDLDLSMKAGSAGALELPDYFKAEEVGGDLSHHTNIEVFDSLGVSHVLEAAFVKTDNPNKWDMVLTSITGDVDVVTRRISGITFLNDGTFGALEDPAANSFAMKFAHDPGTVANIKVDLGTPGTMNGLSQVGGQATAAPSQQDGYTAGWLSNVSVTREGVVLGVFTNGVRKDIAALKLATFQNPAALLAQGNNYFTSSANSGEAIPTRGLSGSAGAVQGGSLEKSNVDVATEFVNLIQAQNGFLANSRTIRIGNDMLQQLTQLIR
jgi:flagellar hook protein FlgE